MMFYDLVYRASNYLEEKIIYRNETLHGIKVKQSAESTGMSEQQEKVCSKVKILLAIFIINICSTFPIQLSICIQMWTHYWYD